MRGLVGISASLFLVLLVQSPARASVVTGTVTYFAVPEHGNHDFGNPIFCSPCGQHYSNEVTGTLGPNGLPVLDPSYIGPHITDLRNHNQLDWWDPRERIGTGTFSTDLSGHYDQHLFAFGANNDGRFFETAIYNTTNLAANTTYTITYSGDDDVFLALNGKVISQDGGVHAIGQFDTVSFSTGAADHQLEIFFADRYNVQSELEFNISAVPEPSTWAMMVLGLTGVGFMAYRRKRKPAWRLA
jgi:hypothetical protein